MLVNSPILHTGGAVLLGRDRRVRLAIARLAYGLSEHPSVGSWLARTCHSFLTSARYGGLTEFPVDRAPVYAARNYATAVAMAAKADYLVMVDADSIPDCVPGAPPFFDVAMAVAIENGPCVVAAPVPMVNGCVNVHRQEVDADGQQNLVLMTLEEVALRRGVAREVACGTGLVLIDMRCFAALAPPYFSFVYTDESCSEVAAGEDVGFTARLADAGIPTLVCWDSWCGHRKAVALGSPVGDKR